MTQLNKFTSCWLLSPRITLIVVICVSLGLTWDLVLAQSRKNAGHATSTVPGPAVSNDDPQDGSDIQPENEPRELPGFFIIGIAINILLILLFAFWFVNQWKRQSKNKLSEKQE